MHSNFTDALGNEMWGISTKMACVCNLAVNKLLFITEGGEHSNSKNVYKAIRGLIPRSTSIALSHIPSHAKHFNKRHVPGCQCHNAFFISRKTEYD